MSNETMALRGRLSVAEATIRSLSLGIDCDIDEARSLLDKYADKTMLQSGKLKVIIDRLDNQVVQITKLTQQAASIKSDLGE
ncbi:MAG: hypothetical protein WC898_02355 [Candidatus Paceibacterota bacterium]|jgi:hypothetical protein